MKLVEFTRDMRPQTAGSTRLVPDEMAEQLVAEGVARDLGTFPPGAAPDAVRKLSRRERRYQTKS